MNLFHIDSPLIQKLAKLANLIFLNLLWLVFCIPVITAGAATTAMYQLVFEYINGTEDSVFLPFLRAFSRNFKRSTLIWVAILFIGAILAYDFLFLSVSGLSSLHPLWIVFYLVCIFLLIVLTYIFPLEARFHNSILNQFRNCYTLFVLNFLPSIALLLLAALPWLLILLSPSLFLKTSIFWIMVGFALCAYLSGIILLHIFRKYSHDEASG